MLARLTGIVKHYGGVAALRDGNLTIAPGEVHLLLGENGAGKSTLMRILAGFERPDAGVLEWQDRCAGVAMVHQESLLAPHLTVAENIWLGREPGPGWGLVDRRGMLGAARRLIDEHGFPLDAAARVERLSPAGRQLVEICRALAQGSRLLIFDEPTSALAQAESTAVFRAVRGLRERGMAVVYITHRLEELRELGDRVTILRDGATVWTGAIEDITTPEIIRHMVGRDVEFLHVRAPRPPGAELLRVAFPGGELALHAGEIVGVAGLAGAGRSALCRTIFGVAPWTGMRLTLNGRPLRLRTPRDAVRAGIALVPEDRQRHGLATGLAAGYNMTLASLPDVSRWGILRAGAENAAIGKMSLRLGLHAASAEQPAGRLSGGNQQKVAVAKWLLSGARVFLFDEPTRGIDIAAKREVFVLMDELAQAGAAVLMVSSELGELQQMADRVLVMRAGQIAAELGRAPSQDEMLRHAALGAPA